MSATITLNQEQLDELERVLNAHCSPSLVEIHRTENSRFRLELERRLELQEQILQEIRQARAAT